MINFILRAARIITYTLTNFSEACEINMGGGKIVDVCTFGEDITMLEIDHPVYHTPWDQYDSLEDAMYERLEIDPDRVIDIDELSDDTVVQIVANEMGIEISSD